MSTMSDLDKKIKEAALDISIKHLLRNKGKAPKKIADRIVRLCLDVYGEYFAGEDYVHLIKELIAKFRTLDDTQICRWIHDRFNSDK